MIQITIKGAPYAFLFRYQLEENSANWQSIASSAYFWHLSELGRVSSFTRCLSRVSLPLIRGLPIIAQISSSTNEWATGEETLFLPPMLD